MKKFLAAVVAVFALFGAASVVSAAPASADTTWGL